MSRILIHVWEAVSAQKFSASFFDSLFGVSETCRLSDIDEDSALSFSVRSLVEAHFLSNIFSSPKVAVLLDYMRYDLTR